MMKRFISSFMIVVAVLILAACTDKMKEVSALDLEHYQPVDKFVPAYEALTNRTDLTTNEDYDIEQTVRVKNIQLPPSFQAQSAEPAPKE